MSTGRGCNSIGSPSAVVMRMNGIRTVVPSMSVTLDV
jgi:hypothetical protein